MRITADNLTFIYNPKSPFRTTAIEGVSLTVGEGEFFGIIGHTGSGKSTFIQHLNGLLKPASGSIRLGDIHLYNLKKEKKRAKSDAKTTGFSRRELLKQRKISKKSLKRDSIEIRAKVGMVFQYPEYQLFAETVKADVAFGIRNFVRKQQREINENEIETMVRQAVETVGLNYDEIKDKSPFELSGGQKRRVAIAGVIATKPEVLVLDEPAAGLDPQGKEELFALLHRLKGTVCKTIIIVSHDMDDIAENCTMVAVFNEGKIIRAEKPETLFKDAEFLRGVGLDLPLSAYICLKLKEKGVNISTDFTERDFLNKLEERMKGDKA